MIKFFNQESVLNPRSAHIGGKSLVDELLQRLRLRLVGDGAHNGITHDVAAAVHHIGGGVGEHVLHKLAGLALGGEVDIGIGDALLGQNGLGLGDGSLIAAQGEGIDADDTAALLGQLLMPWDNSID